MTGDVRFKLSLMMFLEFFIWGAWFEMGFAYIPGLGFSDDQNALIFGAFNLGALVALFFSTQFADRNFAAEKFLAFSHLVGGAALLGLYFLPVAPPPDAAAIEAAKAAGETLPPRADFWLFFGLMLLYSLFYVPTISITNSIAFNAMTDPARQFGPIRVWGTIGWIVASWPFIFLLVDWDKVNAMPADSFADRINNVLDKSVALTGVALEKGRSLIFLVAGIAALLLSAFSLVLPHTPPKPASGEDSLAWLKAMKLLRHPFVLVLFIVTFIDAAVHQSFFVLTPGFLGPINEGGVVDIPANWVTPVMKIGQIAEIVTMLFLGYVLKTFGWRITMIIGVLGHAARFAVFAYAPTQFPEFMKEACIIVNVLHGICYAFFFATVYIFVDEYFPKDVRSSAQGLFNVLILGFGPFLANFGVAWLKKKYTPAATHNYEPVFEYVLSAALIGALLLALFFHPPRKGNSVMP